MAVDLSHTSLAQGAGTRYPLAGRIRGSCADRCCGILPTMAKPQPSWFFHWGHRVLYTWRLRGDEWTYDQRDAGVAIHETPRMGTSSPYANEVMVYPIEAHTLDETHPIHIQPPGPVRVEVLEADQDGAPLLLPSLDGLLQAQVSWLKKEIGGVGPGGLLAPSPPRNVIKEIVERQSLISVMMQRALAPSSGAFLVPGPLLSTITTEQRKLHVPSSAEAAFALQVLDEILEMILARLPEAVRTWWKGPQAPQWFTRHRLTTELVQAFERQEPTLVVGGGDRPLFGMVQRDAPEGLARVCQARFRLELPTVPDEDWWEVLQRPDRSGEAPLAWPDTADGLFCFGLAPKMLIVHQRESGRKLTQIPPQTPLPTGKPKAPPVLSPPEQAQPLPPPVPEPSPKAIPPAPTASPRGPALSPMPRKYGGYLPGQITLSRPHNVDSLRVTIDGELAEDAGFAPLRSRGVYRLEHVAVRSGALLRVDYLPEASADD